MTQEEFATKWHHKIVVPKPDGYEIPIQSYKVTAALYHYYEEDESIFAIYGADGMFTIKLTDQQLDTLDEKFEIIED